MPRDLAISVHGLSKSYTIAHQANGRPTTLAEAMLQRLRHPFRQQTKEVFRALKDVSFDVKKGEVVGIIGRNGAGKSTLLKILSRITEPTSGEIEVYGRIGSLLEVGTGFHPELTGRENIFLNGSILGMPRRDISRKFDEIVDFAEIEKFLDTPVKRYSSGMYVRLAFAVAAHLEPNILIVDEVLAVGDQNFQKKCLGKIGDVASKGLTVLLVSHYMDVVRRLCGKALYLDRGAVVAMGPTSDVISLYERETPIVLQPRRVYPIDSLPRTGTGEARFQTVSYSSDAEDLSGTAYADGPLTVEVEINAHSNLELNSLALIVFSRDRVKLMNADILSLGATQQLHPGMNRIRFDVKRLHLKPNRYVLGLWCANWPMATYDYLEYVGEIDVKSKAALEGPPSDGVVTCDFSVLANGQKDTQ